MEKDTQIQLSEQATQVRKLMTSKTPKDFIEQREGRGGKRFDYVEIGYVKAMLNHNFPLGWSYTTELVFPISEALTLGQVAVKVELKLTDHNGHELIFTGFGGTDIKKQGETITAWEQGKKVTKPNPKAGQIIDIGDDLKSAEADALKKSASNLIAFDVYHPNVVAKMEALKARLSTSAPKTPPAKPQQASQGTDATVEAVKETFPGSKEVDNDLEAIGKATDEAMDEVIDIGDEEHSDPAFIPKTEAGKKMAEGISKAKEPKEVIQ